MSDRVQALKGRISDFVLLAMSVQLTWCMEKIESKDIPMVGRKDADEFANQIVSFLVSQELGQMIDGKFVPLEIK